MESNILSVSEVTARIKKILTLDEILSDLTVEGEISNFHHHSSGHMYFTLKDSEATLSSVMFEHKNKDLDFEPEDGQQVKASGYIDVYKPRGEYQLYVKELEKVGAGDLYKQYLELKEKLKEEGLFDEERKQDLPFLPARIGLVTSPTGAAIRDILSVLKRRFAAISALLVPAHVQGDKAESELIRGVEYLEGKEDIDLIIISRGGGSLEDLWSFNSEKLARTIADCRIPVISGVGHETDFTIADFAADVRAATPSAAAELAVSDYIELRDRLEDLGKRIVSAFENNLKSRERRLDNMINRHIWREPQRLFASAEQEVDSLADRFSRELSRYFEDRRNHLGQLSGLLDNLSPLKILSRGYSITRREDGEIITSAEDVDEGENIETRLSRGFILSEIKSKGEDVDSFE